MIADPPPVAQVQATAPATMAKTQTPPPPGALLHLGPVPYPPAAIQQHIAGDTQLSITFHDDGSRPVCQLIRSSGSGDLDNASCQAIASAKFIPMPDGRPVVWKGWIGWRLTGVQSAVSRGLAEIQEMAPPNVVREGRSGTVTVSVLIGVDGLPHACQIVTSSGSEGLDTLGCIGILRYAHYTPAKDAGGTPIEAPKIERIKFDFSGAK